MKKQAKHSKSPTDQTTTKRAPGDDVQERVRRRAYELWEQGGYKHGRDVEYWLKAEQELLRRNRSSSASSGS